MHCHHCGKEFEDWKPYEHWDENSDLCPPCYETKWASDSRSRSGKNHFCLTCGSILPMKTRTRNGKPFSSSGWAKHCSCCKPSTKWVKKEKKCIVCGIPLISAYKYCPEHKPFNKIDPVTNRKASIKWQRENRNKVRAQIRARYHAHMTAILYECPCEDVKKENHHPDYELEFLVVRLCDRCHKAEHRRLRALAAQAAQA